MRLMVAWASAYGSVPPQSERERLLHKGVDPRDVRESSPPDHTAPGENRVAPDGRGRRRIESDAPFLAGQIVDLRVRCVLELRITGPQRSG